jgi:capsular polysaccharide transport system permease protein
MVMIKSVKSIVHNADQRRLKRMQALLKRLCIFVMLPTILSALYYGFIASNMYESETQFIIHIGNLQSATNNLTTQHYIQSREALERLNQDYDFIKSYQSKRLDFLNRLPEDVDFDTAYNYYRKLIKISLDPISGIVTMKVRAPTAHKAKVYANALLHYADDTIGKISDGFRNEQLKFAKKELAEAENRLAVAKAAFGKLGEESTETSMLEEALDSKNKFEQELIEAERELKDLLPVLDESSPKITALKNRIEQLRLIIQKENDLILKGSKAGNTLSRVISEKEFAEEVYKSAVNFLETSRNDLLRQHHYLAIIVPPNLASVPTYPDRWVGILKVFVMSLSLYVIASIVIATIREHMKI